LFLLTHFKFTGISALYYFNIPPQFPHSSTIKFCHVTHFIPHLLTLLLLLIL